MIPSNLKERWQHVRLNGNFKGQQTCPLFLRPLFIYIYMYIYIYIYIYICLCVCVWIPFYDLIDERHGTGYDDSFTPMAAEAMKP